MNLFQKACKAIDEYIFDNSKSGDLIKSRQEVIDICRKKYPEITPNGSNMSPSDICYNICNGNRMTKDFRNWPHALEKIDDALYRLLGTGFPYRGPVTWTHSDGHIHYFGFWENGNFEESYSEDIVNTEDMKTEGNSLAKVKAIISVIDGERLGKAIEWFAKYIAVQQGGRSVDFYSGYMEIHEGFKRELFHNGHRALRLDTWNKNIIGSGYILDCVIAGLQAKDNGGKNIVVNYHSITSFKIKAMTNLSMAEDTLFNLYKGDDDGAAFEDACNFFGRWYPVFSYLMFLKDDTKYLPVKNSNQLHGARFQKLNINRECLQYCSWNNYLVFIDVHKQIQEKLKEAFPENQISLLDAHSFVWTLYAAPDDFSFDMDEKLQDISGASDFVAHVKDSLKYREKAQKENEALEESLKESRVEGKERLAIIKARVNQSEFRKRLLLRYKKCCLCGVSDSRLMIASHIKPWSESTAIERTDPDNGFMLCPNHDAVFDQFLISFENDGRIMISDELSNTERIFLNIRDDMRINIQEGNKKYLEYHRNRFHNRGIETL